VAWARYKLARNYPRILFYRNAQVELEIVSKEGLHREVWLLQARKREIGGTSLELASTIYGRDYLDVVLHQDGFTIKEGTPAARMMDHLVRAGWAELMV